MTCQVIYENALRLLAQRVDEDENEDLAERAPYLIAAFCTEASELDNDIRAAYGLPPAAAFEGVWLDLKDPFPLSDKLVPVACLYLAAMLILDEDSELSDRLYDRYCDGMATLRSSIPATTESIIDRYFP